MARLLLVQLSGLRLEARQMGRQRAVIDAERLREFPCGGVGSKPQQEACLCRQVEECCIKDVRRALVAHLRIGCRMDQLKG